MLNREETADHNYRRALALLREGNPTDALSLIYEVLNIEPRHMLALILAGEIYLDKDMNLDPPAAYSTAIGYFNRVLAVEPKYADAWSGKALALLYLEKPGQALDAAENGLFVLPLRIGYGMMSADVYTNVAEALFDRKVCALLSLGRKSDARQALYDGFEHCPGSEYLSRLVKEFMPDSA